MRILISILAIIVIIGGGYATRTLLLADSELFIANINIFNSEIEDSIEANKIIPEIITEEVEFNKVPHTPHNIAIHKSRIDYLKAKTEACGITYRNIGFPNNLLAVPKQMLVKIDVFKQNMIHNGPIRHIYSTHLFCGIFGDNKHNEIAWKNELNYLNLQSALLKQSYEKNAPSLQAMIIHPLNKDFPLH